MSLVILNRTVDTRESIAPWGKETACPPAAHRRAQQEAFDRFKFTYNQQRRGRTGPRDEDPNQMLRTLAAAYPSRLPEPHYDGGLSGPCGVRACGGFSWKGRKIFITEVLRNEPIGFELIEDDFWLVYFATFPIALFDSYQFSIHDLPEQDPTQDGNDGSDGKVER